MSVLVYDYFSLSADQIHTVEIKHGWFLDLFWTHVVLSSNDGPADVASLRLHLHDIWASRHSLVHLLHHISLDCLSRPWVLRERIRHSQVAAELSSG